GSVGGCALPFEPVARTSIVPPTSWPTATPSARTEIVYFFPPPSTLSTKEPLRPQLLLPRFRVTPCASLTSTVIVYETAPTSPLFTSNCSDSGEPALIVLLENESTFTTGW